MLISTFAIPWTPLIIFLALIAAAVLANIITFWAIGGFGKSFPFADPATIRNTDEKSEREKAIEACDCPCHSRRESMFPGMVCIDCMGELCDEGTKQ